MTIGTAYMAGPELLSDVNSPHTVYLLIFLLVVTEAIALFFRECLDYMVEGFLEQCKVFFQCYNIISLLISYFFYPALLLSILGIISLFFNGFDVVHFVFCLVFLLVFALANFVGYRICRWTLEDGDSMNGSFYGAAMVINIPIWIIYIVIFAL